MAARMGVGLFVDCTRVSWSSSAFLNHQRLDQQLGVELSQWMQSDHDVDVTKIHCKLGKEVEDLFKKEYTCQ